MNLESKITPAAALVLQPFDPLRFYDGHVGAKGFVVRRNGDLVRTFVAQFSGVRDKDSITIHEVIDYDDGDQDLRHWHITKSGKGIWTANVEGLVGVCTIRSGKRLEECRWSYRMKVPIKNRLIAFDFEDIMVSLSESEMVSLTPMKKFGITVATINCRYYKL